MIRRPPRSTLSSSSAASDVYKRQGIRVVRVEAQGLAKLLDCFRHPSALHESGAEAIVRDRTLGRAEAKRFFVRSDRLVDPPRFRAHGSQVDEHRRILGGDTEGQPQMVRRLSLI